MPEETQRRSRSLEGIELARRIAELAAEKHAQDIAALNVRGLVDFADFFVIMSGGSARQLDAIQDEVVGKLKKENVTPLHREGSIDSGWLLLDYGDVVVHIFAPEQRQYYQLDQLWADAETVLSIQ